MRVSQITRYRACRSTYLRQMTKQGTKMAFVAHFGLFFFIERAMQGFLTGNECPLTAVPTWWTRPCGGHGCPLRPPPPRCSCSRPRWGSAWPARPGSCPETRPAGSPPAHQNQQFSVSNLSLLLFSLIRKKKYIYYNNRKWCMSLNASICSTYWFF